MLTDLTLAKLCSAVYEDSLPTALGWCGHWEKPGIHVALYSEGEIDYVIFRGSKSLTDFATDLLAIQLARDPELGWVPEGFGVGVRELAKLLDAAIGEQVVCTGHSLGGAQAALYAAHRSVINKPPLALITFGEPKTCTGKIEWLLGAVKTRRAWSNKGDPVFDLPPKVCGNLSHSGTIYEMSIPPTPGDGLGYVAPHRLAYYEAGLPDQLIV